MKAAEIIVQACVAQGKFANSIPYFGFERQGAPVAAFVRIDDRPIRPKTLVYNPECVLVMDDTVINAVDIYSGLKGGGTVVVNSKADPASLAVPEAVGKLAVVDATGLALDILGVNKPNTVILGAFAAATGWVEKEEMIKEVEKVFGARNVNAVEAGFAGVQVVEPGLRQAQGRAGQADPVEQEDFEVPIGVELYVVNTGDWRTHRPVVSDERCNGCGVCAIHCPTSSIRLNKGKNCWIDLNFCKGCGICAGICSRQAIGMEEEGARLIV